MCIASGGENERMDRWLGFLEILDKATFHSLLFLCGCGRLASPTSHSQTFNATNRVT